MGWGGSWVGKASLLGLDAREEGWYVGRCLAFHYAAFFKASNILIFRIKDRCVLRSCLKSSLVFCMSC